MLPGAWDSAGPPPPSTHITSSVSITLFIYPRAYQFYFSESSVTLIICQPILYHLGAAIWVLQRLYLDRTGETIVNGGWEGKRRFFFQSSKQTHTNGDIRSLNIATTAIRLLVVNKHPTCRRLPSFRRRNRVRLCPSGRSSGSLGFLPIWYSPQVLQNSTATFSLYNYSTVTDITTWWLFSIIKVAAGISPSSPGVPSRNPPFNLRFRRFWVPPQRFSHSPAEYDVLPIERRLAPSPSVTDLLGSIACGKWTMGT